MKIRARAHCASTARGSTETAQKQTGQQAGLRHTQARIDDMLVSCHLTLTLIDYLSLAFGIEDQLVVPMTLFLSAQNVARQRDCLSFCVSGGMSRTEGRSCGGRRLKRNCAKGRRDERKKKKEV